MAGLPTDEICSDFYIATITQMSPEVWVPSCWRIGNRVKLCPVSNCL